jgi:hypothetical protein
MICKMPDSITFEMFDKPYSWLLPAVAVLPNRSSSASPDEELPLT